LVVSDIFGAVVKDVVATAPTVCNVVVSGDATAVGTADRSVPGHAWVDRAESGATSEVAVAATTTDSPAFWLYSSGTTGRPKGVMHRHGNLPATYETYATEVLHVGPGDRFLSVAKLFFAYGLGNSLTFPFAAGAT